MRNKVITTLKKARKLITKRENWTQGAHSRTANGKFIGPGAEGACSFCAEGAIIHVSKNDEAGVRSGRALGLTTLYLKGLSVGAYNDSHTHEEVLAAFDMTITGLEKAQ